MSAPRLVRSPRPTRPSLGETDSDQCPLERGPRSLHIGRLPCTFEGMLGLPSGTLGSLEVDFGGHVGGFGQDHDAVRPDLQEPAEDGELLLLSAALDAQHALTERRDQRCVVREYAEFAFAARHDYLVDIAGEGSFLRSDDLEMQRHLNHSSSALAVRVASTVGSGQWSEQPRRRDEPTSLAKRSSRAATLGEATKAVRPRRRESVTSPA